MDAIHFPAYSLGASAAAHSHSLQLATDTELAHHYIKYALSTLSRLLFTFFYVQKDFFEAPRGHIKALERATSHIKV